MLPERRRVSPDAVLSSFATEVSAGVRATLKDAEALGLRGATDDALDLLRRTADGLPTGADDDRVAIGELAQVLSAWSDRLPRCNAFLEQLAAEVTSPSALGALYFYRGRGSVAAESTEFLSRALDEFTICGDLRGRAIALGQLCWPTEAPVGHEYRLRVGREGLALARRLGDPWTIAFCAGRLAGCETYLDHPDALEHWRQATQVLPASADSVTAEIAALNTYNWGLTAFAHGDYALARRIFSEGRPTAHGAGWEHRYDAALALVTARSEGPSASAERAAALHAMDGIPVAAVVLAAHALQVERRPDARMLDAAIELLAHDEQMRWTALALQAHIRAVRREPDPMRDLHGVVDQAVRSGTRLGWEDALLVMAAHDPALGRDARERLDHLWPSYPRGVAMRHFVDGLLAGPAGFASLMRGAREFLDLPEPLTAGAALHAAAGVAPTAAEANRLRERAIDLYSAIGAERALAGVIRDRRSHRGPNHPHIPASQRYATTAGLTTRESEVAQLAALGLTATEIASELQISVSTARHHIRSVREKFGGVPKRKLATLLAPRAR